ncbi:integrase core domain-containing protein [Dehalococcoidia bacterium]|nr:integrase core domain-containing protein [Dehalococcoidia bacterium]
MMESFFKTLKHEEVHLCEYETYHDVVTRLPHFIEDVYNQKRLHSALGYRPPNEFEEVVLTQRINTTPPDSPNPISNHRGTVHNDVRKTFKDGNRTKMEDNDFVKKLFQELP